MSPLCPLNICVAAYVWTQLENKCANLLLILSRRLLLLVGHVALVYLRLPNPQLGADQPSGLSPPASHALVPGVASLPAFFQMLPGACRFSAFIFSLNFPQDVMQKGRKEWALQNFGDIAYFLLLLKTSPCMHTVMQAPPFCISKKYLSLEVFRLQGCWSKRESFTN